MRQNADDIKYANYLCYFFGKVLHVSLVKKRKEKNDILRLIRLKTFINKSYKKRNINAFS